MHGATIKKGSTYCTHAHTRAHTHTRTHTHTLSTSRLAPSADLINFLHRLSYRRERIEFSVKRQRFSSFPRVLTRSTHRAVEKTHRHLSQFYGSDDDTRIIKKRKSPFGLRPSSLQSPKEDFFHTIFSL